MDSRPSTPTPLATKVKKIYDKDVLAFIKPIEKCDLNILPCLPDETIDSDKDADSNAEEKDLRVRALKYQPYCSSYLLIMREHPKLYYVNNINACIPIPMDEKQTEAYIKKVRLIASSATTQLKLLKLNEAQLCELRAISGHTPEPGPRYVEEDLPMEDGNFSLIETSRAEVVSFLLPCFDGVSNLPDSDYVKLLKDEAITWHIQKKMGSVEEQKALSIIRNSKAHKISEKDLLSVETFLCANYVKHGIGEDPTVSLTQTAACIFAEEKSFSIQFLTLTEGRTFDNEVIIALTRHYTSHRHITSYMLLVKKDGSLCRLQVAHEYEAAKKIEDFSMFADSVDVIGDDGQSAPLVEEKSKIQQVIGAQRNQEELLALPYDMNYFDERLYVRGCNFHVVSAKPADLILEASQSDSKDSKPASPVRGNEKYRDSYIFVKSDPLSTAKLYYVDTLNSQTKCNTVYTRCCYGTKIPPALPGREMHDILLT